MKSVGEVMAIGRTFKEAFLKAVRSLETGKEPGSEVIDKDRIRQKLITPTPERIPYLLYAVGNGFSIDELVEMTHIDPWFLNEMKEIADLMKEVSAHKLETLPAELLREAKRAGLSDSHLARFLGTKASAVAASQPSRRGHAGERTIRDAAASRIAVHAMDPENGTDCPTLDPATGRARASPPTVAAARESPSLRRNQ